MEALQLVETNFFRYYHEKGCLSKDDLMSLNSYYTFKELAIGQYVLRESEICKHVLFVEQGLLTSFSLDDKGVEHIIQFSGENWVVADRASMYFNEPSTFYIKAIEPTILVYLSPLFFEEASRMNPNFDRFNDQSLHRHIHSQQKRINSLLAMNAKERYLSFLGTYPDLVLRVPQWMIASYLGITPESLSRVRREILR